MRPSACSERRWCRSYIGRNVERDWRGQRWSNATHTSVTDPDPRLYRKAKGKPAQLCYMGHALTENRYGFMVEATLTHADGTSECRSTCSTRSTRRITLGADKGYDSDRFRAVISAAGAEAVMPSIGSRSQAIAYDQYAYKERNLVERFFCWIKQFRRIATRYEKTATSFAAMLHIAAAMVWLR